MESRACSIQGILRIQIERESSNTSMQGRSWAKALAARLTCRFPCALESRHLRWTGPLQLRQKRVFNAVAQQFAEKGYRNLFMPILTISKEGRYLRPPTGIK